jgi:hypothetical protein
MALIGQSLESELARLNELRRRHGDATPIFLDWLDDDIAALEHRHARFNAEVA